MTATLDTPVPLLQHPGEFAELLDLYRTLKPKTVLEVGTYHGGTLYHWLTNAQPGAVVVSVDSYATGIDNTSHYHQWAADNVEAVAIRGDSNDTATSLAAAGYGPYDFIYIDADHHDTAVRTDWRLYSDLAAPGATIALHDITPSSDPSINVAPLWADIQAEHDTTEITRDGGFGIGIVHWTGS